MVNGRRAAHLLVVRKPPAEQDEPALALPKVEADAQGMQGTGATRTTGPVSGAISRPSMSPAPATGAPATGAPATGAMETATAATRASDSEVTLNGPPPLFGPDRCLIPRPAQPPRPRPVLPAAESGSQGPATDRTPGASQGPATERSPFAPSVLFAAEGDVSTALLQSALGVRGVLVGSCGFDELSQRIGSSGPDLVVLTLSCIVHRPLAELSQLIRTAALEATSFALLCEHPLPVRTRHQLMDAGVRAFFDACESIEKTADQISVFAKQVQNEAGSSAELNDTYLGDIFRTISEMVRRGANVPHRSSQSTDDSVVMVLRAGARLDHAMREFVNEIQRSMMWFEHRPRAGEPVGGRDAEVELASELSGISVAVVDSRRAHSAELLGWLSARGAQAFSVSANPTDAQWQELRSRVPQALVVPSDGVKTGVVKRAAQDPCLRWLHVVAVDWKSAPGQTLEQWRAPLGAALRELRDGHRLRFTQALNSDLRLPLEVMGPTALFRVAAAERQRLALVLRQGHRILRVELGRGRIWGAEVSTAKSDPLGRTLGTSALADWMSVSSGTVEIESDPTLMRLQNLDQDTDSALAAACLLAPGAAAPSLFRVRADSLAPLWKSRAPSVRPRSRWSLAPVAHAVARSSGVRVLLAATALGTLFGVGTWVGRVFLVEPIPGSASTSQSQEVAAVAAARPVAIPSSLPAAAGPPTSLPPPLAAPGAPPALPSGSVVGAPQVLDMGENVSLAPFGLAFPPCPPTAIDRAFPGAAGISFREGEKAYGSGAYQSAERAYCRAIALDSQGRSAVLGLVRVLLLEGRGADAVRWAGVARRLAPTDPGAMALLGDALAQSGSLNPAMALWLQSEGFNSEQKDKAASLFLSRGKDARDCGSLDKAERFYRRAHLLGKGPEAACSLSTLALMRKAPEEAVSWAEKALERAPGDPLVIRLVVGARSATALQPSSPAKGTGPILAPAGSAPPPASEPE